MAANNLASYLAERGDLEAALQLAQTAKAGLPDDPRVSDTLGWIYYKKNLASLAVTSLEHSVSKNPSNPMSHYHLGLAYLKDGKTAAAQKALQRALQLNPTFTSAEDAKHVLATIKG